MLCVGSGVFQRLGIHGAWTSVNILKTLDPGLRRDDGVRE